MPGSTKTAVHTKMNSYEPHPLVNDGRLAENGERCTYQQTGQQNKTSSVMEESAEEMLVE